MGITLVYKPKCADNLIFLTTYVHLEKTKTSKERFEKTKTTHTAERPRSRVAWTPVSRHDRRKGGNCRPLSHV